MNEKTPAGATPRRYDEAFKAEAVRLWKTSGRSAEVTARTASCSFVLTHKIHMQIGLTVNNLFDYTKPIYYNTLQRPPGGDVTNPGRVATPANYWLFAPRNYMPTSKIAF